MQTHGRVGGIRIPHFYIMKMKIIVLFWFKTDPLKRKSDFALWLENLRQQIIL